MRYHLAVLLALLAAFQVSSMAQGLNPDKISISSQPTLDAAGPKQRIAIKAVYLVVCQKDDVAGTGFLTKNHIIVTNQHVVGSCTKDDLMAIAPDDHRISFSMVVTDKDRDLALLKPAEELTGGLELASNDDPMPGTEVSTWGYPFLYDGVYPLLSVGYVAGFRQEQTPTRRVKHLIVNGAFNHGNSGGPLLLAREDRVIGVVVATYHFFPSYVQDTIDALKKPAGGYSSGRFSVTGPDGQRQGLMDEQVIGIVLEEFYHKTQVMIGEAISVSELRAFIKENRSALGLPPEELKAEKKRK